MIITAGIAAHMKVFICIMYGKISYETCVLVRDCLLFSSISVVRDRWSRFI